MSGGDKHSFYHSELREASKTVYAGYQSGRNTDKFEKQVQTNVKTSVVQPWDNITNTTSNKIETINERQAFVLHILKKDLLRYG